MSSTYLELPDENGVARLFFELTVQGSSITVRYGDIGAAGKQSARDFGSAAAALAEADRLIAARRRKGYSDAIPGQSTAAGAQDDIQDAPVLWRFNTHSQAFGLFVNDDGCWVGNEEGKLFSLDIDGLPQKSFQLPDGVKSIVADGDWLYVGCDNGRVYDLTGGRPVEAYAIDNSVDIYWLDIADARLAVSDAKGNIYVFDHNHSRQWVKTSSGEQGWMVRFAPEGVYHGHMKGLTIYDRTGSGPLVHRDTGGAVNFGALGERNVYIATNARAVVCFSRAGLANHRYTARCDAAVYCCVASEDEQYLFAADCDGAIYCFDDQGRRVWKMRTGCGSALTMQYFDECLYMVTSKGVLACVDASDEAVEESRQGSLPTPRDLRPIEQNATLAVLSVGALPQVKDIGTGVVLECSTDGSGALSVRVVSAGYRSDWPVQFPQNLRQAGVRYVVDDVRAASSGDFYRAFGDIRRLIG
ncbi:MAG: WGR domain-containing protein [Myxococcota bacterium]